MRKKAVITTDIAIDGINSKDRCEELLKWTSENIKLEWKEFGIPDSETENAALAKAIIAMANTYGGYIILGKAKNGYLKGISASTIDADVILKKINKFVLPAIKDIKVGLYKINKLNIGLVYVPPSDEIPHITIKDSQDFKKNIIYTRKSGSSDLADYSDYQRIFNEIFKRRALEYTEYLRKTPIMESMEEIRTAILNIEKHIIKSKKIKKTEDKSILTKYTPQALALIKDEDFVMALERWYKKK